jgi:hypothetical protein
MAEGLPEGLVSNTAAIREDIQGVGVMDPEDLRMMWRGKSMLPYMSAWTLKLMIPPSVYYEAESAGTFGQSETGESILEDLGQWADT